jgi:hypothetical protein
MLSNVHSYMFIVKIIINICKHVIGQKVHVKAWNCECEMYFQWVKRGNFL